MNRSILILQTGSDLVRDEIRALSQKGMIQELLILSDDLRPQRLVNGNLQEIDLFSYLAKLRLDRVRCIVMVSADQEVNPLVLELVEEIEGNQAPVGTKVDKYVIALPKDGEELNGEVFQPFWNYNLIIEPVDMAGEHGFARLPVKDDKKQAVIAASFGCFVGGLWKWLTESPFDNNGIRSSVGNSAQYDPTGQVRIVRLVTRLVDAGDVTMQAVSRAMSPGVQLPPPPGCVRESAPAQVIESLVGKFTDRQDPLGLGLAYRLHPGLPVPEVEKKGLIAYLTAFFNELVEELRRMPESFIDKQIAVAKARVAHYVATKTYGEDSQIQLDLSTISQKDGQDIGQSIRDGIVRLHSGRSDVPSPETWHGLAQVIFALIDGSDPSRVKNLELPSGVDGRRVITDPKHFAPEDILDASRGYLATDFLAREDLDSLHWSEEVIRSFDAQRYDAVLKLVVKDDENEKQGINALSSSKEASSKTPKDSPKDASTDQPSRAAAKKKMSKWLGNRSNTLLWKLAEGLAKQLQRSEEDFVNLSTLVTQQVEVIQAREQESRLGRRKFRKRLWVLLILLLVTVAGGLVGFFVLPVFGVLVGFGFLVLGLMSSLVMIYRTAKSRVRQRHLNNEAATRLQSLLDLQEHALSESARLASLYQQYLDWAEVYALTIWCPLGSSSITGVEAWASDSNCLSLVSGVPIISDAKTKAMTVKAMQLLARRGWLNSIYQRRREMTVASYEELFHLTDEEISPPEIDCDSSTQSNYFVPSTIGSETIQISAPRRFLLESFRVGRFADDVRESEVRAIKESGFQKDLVTVVDHVECEIPGLSDPRRSVEEFLRPIVEWDEIPDFSALLVPERQVQGLEVRSAVGASAFLVPDGSEALTLDPLDDRVTFGAFRLDISAPILIEETTICRSFGVQADRSDSNGEADSDFPEFG